MKTMKQESTGRRTNALMVDKCKQEWKCYGCGENGQFQRDCKYGGQTKSGRQSRGRRGTRFNHYRGRSSNCQGQQVHCSYAKHEGKKEEANAWLTR